jgi:hypothetical protein
VGAALYDTCPTGAIPKPGKDAIVSDIILIPGKITLTTTPITRRPTKSASKRSMKRIMPC